MNANILIRRILETEWKVYRELRLKALKYAPEAFGAKYEDAILRLDSDWMLQTKNVSKGNDAIILIAFVNDSPLGMIGCYLNSGAKGKAEMVQMWTDPSVRKLGIGKELITQLKQWTKSIGASYLFATVYKNNIVALNLYKKLGFLETEEVNFEIYLRCLL